MASRPIQSARQIFPGFRLVQPEFVVRHHERGADEPYPRFLFLHQNLASGELLAERNLSIRADDLYAGLGSESFHSCAHSLIWRSAPRECKVSAVIWHERTIARKHNRPLLDHLGGPQQKRLRHLDAERLGGLEVDDQLEG